MKVLIKCQTVIEEHLGTHTECVYLIHLAALLPFGDGYESTHTHMRLVSPLTSIKPSTKMSFSTLKVILQEYIHYFYRVRSAAQARKQTDNISAQLFELFTA